MATNYSENTNPAFTPTVSEVSANVAEQAVKVITGTQRAADTAAGKLHQGLDNLRDDVPFALSRLGATADSLLAEGAERARETAQAIRNRAEPMQRQAETYIRNKPVQSVLLAAGVGALITLLMTRSSGR